VPGVGRAGETVERSALGGGLSVDRVYDGVALDPRPPRATPVDPPAE
jgi:hypothetical protein